MIQLIKLLVSELQTLIKDYTLPLRLYKDDFQIGVLRFREIAKCVVRLPQTRDSTSA